MAQAETIHSTSPDEDAVKASIILEALAAWDAATPERRDAALKFLRRAAAKRSASHA